MSVFINTIEVLGDEATMDAIIERTITEFKDDTLTEIGQFAFSGCTALKTVVLPKITEVKNSVFSQCTALSEVHLPLVTNIAQDGFSNCSSLTSIELPLLTTMSYNSFNSAGLIEVNFPMLTNCDLQNFQNCRSLKKVKLPCVKKFGTNAFGNCSALEVVDSSSIISLGNCFSGCTSLTTVIFRNESQVVAVDHSYTIFPNCPITAGTGYIFVPRALIEDYKSATNWSAYGDQFRALEDYTVDGTITGELDETKI